MRERMIIELVLQIALLLWLTLTEALAASLAKPGCPDKCGNITIPYPFGIGPNCFVDVKPYYSFEIICNKSFTPPKPFITGVDLEVLEIFHPTQTVRVNNPVITSNCGNRVNNQLVNLNDTPFYFSDTYTRLTVMGCDNLALITDQDKVIGGCMSICSGNSKSEGCYGIDCCQTTIPPPPSSDTINASFRNIDLNNDTKGCKYALMVDQEWFTNLTNPYVVREMDKVPVVLSWGTYKGCNTFDYYISTASNSSLCGTNASCSFNQSSIYELCQCDHGYEGNPYLPHGCQDIDECERNDTHTCEKICENTPGSYKCHCPPGYSPFGPHGRYCYKLKEGNRNVIIIADIDECKRNNTNHCHMNCKNTPGSYKCHCPPRYSPLFPDESYCYKLKEGNRHVIIIAGSSTGLGILFLLIGTWWMIKLVKRRREIKLKEKFFKRNGGLLLQQQLSSGDSNVEKTKLFTSKELENATDHFNENRILGQGGQGTVYKGMLIDGKIVAVKKSKIVDEGQLEQFINEVVILSQIIHRNIVKLHGCCLETEVPLLVYEFIPNGTLFQYIHDQNEDFPLSWDIRVQIAIEVAGALSYLHSAASIPIYHRDIKSTNILLDDKYRAKVSDFGTSRSIAGDQTHLTTKVQGTFGYLDPEYFQSSQFTDKSDVYSFGVVLVELLTGQKAISSAKSEEWQSLAAYFILTMKENRLFDILDARVVKEGVKGEIMRVANLAKQCLNLNRRKRPTMKEVAIELEAIRMTHGASTIQQNYKEVEFVVAGLIRRAASTSTSFYQDSSVSSSSDVEYLLSK